MKCMYMIFDKSSIHGLPYLTSKHHGSLGRLVWLLCVLVSFSLATLVIWRNIYSWQSQPTVVSSVEYALVEDQSWLPQLIVCPNSLNALAMFDGLLRATYKEIITPEREDGLRLVLAKVKTMDEYLLSSRMWFNQRKFEVKNLAPYERCFGHKNNLTEACNLILGLAVLHNKCGFDKAQEIIVTFGAKLMVEPGTVGLLDYMSKNHNINQLEIEGVNSSSLATYNGVLTLYQTFFDVLNKTTKSLLDPQPLSSYIKNMPRFQLPENYQLGLSLSWTLNGFNEGRYRRNIGINQYSAVQELSNVVSAIWLDALKAYLRVGSNKEAILLMNSFWHAGLDSSIFKPFKERTAKRYLCSTTSEKHNINDLGNVCNGPKKLDIECAAYCLLISNLTSETHTRIKEVLNMGLDTETKPHGTFQSCQHPTKGIFTASECWKIVVNDKGVCYTSKGNGKISNIVPGVMLNSPIQYLFDWGHHVEIHEVAPNTYRMGPIPANPGYPSKLSRKVATYIVPFYQNAVEDMLWEQEIKQGDLTRTPNVITSDPYHFYQGSLTTQNIWAHIDYVHNSTKALKAMNPKQKNCYLPNEKKLTNFEEYSEADCMLECSWELALRHCHCVPWYLSDMYSHYNICEIFGNRCFKNIVATRYKKESLAKIQCQSSCLLNCDMIQYSTKRDYGQLDSHPELVDVYLSQKLNEIPQDVLTLSNNTNAYLVKGNLYVLELRLSNNKLAQKIVRTATMTTTDLISNVGGTLGLFCGLSVLSLVEVVYWAGRTIWSLITKKKEQLKRKPNL